MDLNILIKNFNYKSWLSKSIDEILKIEKIKDDQISIVICGDKLIHDLNKKYRKKDKTTDVLSFAEMDINKKYKNFQKEYLGEIFINYKQAKRQSNNIKMELISLFVHGYLHLIGYLHETDLEEKKMNKRAEKLILKAKIKI